MKSRNFSKIFIFLLTLAVLGAGIGSCQSAKRVRGKVVHEIYIAGDSVEKRPIEYQVLGEGPDVVFIMAAIHGNEQAGIKLCLRLADYLTANPKLLQGRKVVLLPSANPDGVARNQRYNAHGVDLNRNFQASYRENNERYGQAGLSEPETQIIAQIIEDYNPRRIITLHEPLNCIDYDGPYQELAEYLAQYTDIPVRKLGTSPGSLGAYAGVDLNIPLITIEFPRGSSGIDANTLWQHYGRLMQATIVYPERLK